MKLGRKIFCAGLVAAIAYGVWVVFVTLDYGKEVKEFGAESCTLAAPEIPGIEDITLVNPKFALGVSDDRLELWERSNPNTPNGKIVLINLQD
jgi:hypothetical protein